jgi:acyl carrier protein phosphodiesterase
MNFLAHAYLSFSDPGLLTGNMISDFVKGKKKFDYPLHIQNGIHLHRLIDNFTDFHPATAKAKMIFRPEYRLYSGAFVDVVYDHFLAIDTDQFQNGLKQFSEETYTLLKQNQQNFAPGFQKIFPYMESKNWLYGYRLKENVYKAFTGLVYRSKYLQECDVAFQLFNKNYEELKISYQEFFPELKEYSIKMVSNLSPS